MKLRPYQIEGLKAIRDGWDNNVLNSFCQLPTGTGKSLMQVELAYQVTQQGGRVAYVVPFDHLIANARKNLVLKFHSDQIGVVKAEHNQPDRPVVLCSVQTLLGESRLEQVAGKFDLVIVDEGHYFCALRWKEVTEQLTKPGGRLLGFSATIKRLDEKPLNEVFGELVYSRPLWQMIEEGWLCNLKGIRLDAQIDFSVLGQGEFRDDELAPLLETTKAMELIYQGWHEYAHDRVTIAYTPSVRSAHDYAAYWNSKGVPTVAIDGTMTEKQCDKILSDFTEGVYQVLINCAKLIVGFDHPPISAVLMCRPTKSQTLWIQCSGRGTRKCSQEMYSACTQPIKDRVKSRKDDCLILDVGGSSELGLVQFPGLFDLPGPAMRVAYEKYRDGEELNLHEVVRANKPLYEAQAIIATRLDLVQESRFVWVKTQWGWTAEIEGTRISIVKYGRREFTVELQVQTDEGRKIVPLQEEPVSLEWAMVLAEEWVKGRLEENPDGARLVVRDAGWRDGLVTQRQYDVLRRRYRKRFSEWPTFEDYLEKCAEPVTKGEASELIGAKFAESDRRKAEKENKDAQYGNGAKARRQ